MKLRVLDEARADIIRAASWYEDERPGLGERFAAAVEQAFQKIERSPQRFGLVESVELPATFRRCRLQRFPCFIPFEIRATEILVYAVSHARRDPEHWVPRIERPATGEPE